MSFCKISAFNLCCQCFKSWHHFNYWTFSWQIIFKSLEISEMTIFYLSGQFIGLISPVIRALAGQGNQSEFTSCILPLHISNCICKLIHSHLLSRESSLCRALFSFCLASFVRFFFSKFLFCQVYFCFAFSLLRNCCSLCCFDLQVLVRIKGHEKQKHGFLVGGKLQIFISMWLFIVINYYGDLELVYFCLTLFITIPVCF